MISDVMIDLPDRFAVMRRQESTIYRNEDYLSQERQMHQEQHESRGRKSSTASSDDSASSNSSVNEVWREKICEWSYQVVDHFDFNREIVSISLSYLDRFLSTRPVNKKIFQLAAMTTLYLAIKLNEQGTLKMSSLIELSRGYFMVEHIAAMEEAILRALSWYVHPPTSLAFVRHLLMLIPSGSCSREVKHELLELARFLTELAVCDYFFVTRKPSSIALAAVLNAMEGMNPSRLPEDVRQRFVESVRIFVRMDCNDEEVEECQARLREMYYQGGYYQNHQETPKEHEGAGFDDDDRGCSPFCVADVDCDQPANYSQSSQYYDSH